MKLILASKNEHKVEEFRRILLPLGWEILPQDTICPDLEIEEPGTTLPKTPISRQWESTVCPDCLL